MPSLGERFEDVWRRYLEAHTLPSTRAGHYVATGYGVGLGAAGFITLDIMLILAAMGGGYVMAVASHYLFERRKAHGPWKPLVKTDPILGIGADFRMIYLAMTGGLDGELRRFGLLEDEPRT